MAGTWAPYNGGEAVVLAVILIVIAAALAFLGLRLKQPKAPARPSRLVVFFLVTIWAVSLLAFIVDGASYGVILEKANLVSTYQSYTAPNPVSHITELSALVAFIAILILTRKHGLKLALLSAFVGAITAPMIFEMPFDLIVLDRIYPPIPPAPIVFRLLFFLPLILIEISTMSFMTFSPLTRLNRYTLFTLAGFFLVFAAWAAVGFGYPSDPLDNAFNDISKVLAFVAAITFFLGDRGAGSRPAATTAVRA